MNQVHIADYLLVLAQANKSPLTILAYQRNLAKLEALLSPIARDDGSLEKKHIIYALKALSLKNAHPKTMAQMLSAWRQFCAYCVEEGYFAQNPCDGLKPPKLPQRLPKSLSQEKITQLLCLEPENTVQIRDKAIFELLYATGLRLAEVVSLNLNSIDIQQGFLRAIGKGNKERIVPIGGYALRALAVYLPVRAAQANECALFTNQMGGRLGARQLAKRLDLWALKSAEVRKISPHMLRHSMASHVLQSSRDLRAVQELLGHASLSSTQVYTSLDFQHLATIYDEAHPRAKKK